MARKTGRNLVIVIFPYLFLYDKDGFVFESLHIKPSYSDLVDKEGKEIKDNLIRVAKLFRVGQNKQILQWSYIISYVSNTRQWDNLKKRLNKLTTLLRFSQLSDLKEHVQFDNFNYFVFEINRENKFGYFRGYLNGESPFGFSINNGETSNPYQPLVDLHPVIVTTNEIKEDKYLNWLHFFKRMLPENETDKILRAIEWFNRSYSHYGRGVDSTDAILNVQTAIEALLRPEDEDRAVKSQIKTALLNLLGHSKELSLWLDSFWSLRNSIVHGDVKPDSLSYIHPGGHKGHRRHIDIARKIFVKSLDIILKIRAEFPFLILEQELVSNEIRIKEAIKLLNKIRNGDIKTVAKKGTFEFISALRNDDISANKIQTKLLGELLLPLVKKDLELNEKTEVGHSLIEAVDEIQKWKGEDLTQLALLYSKLEQNYDQVYFKDVIDFPLEFLSLRGAAYNFFGFATWHLLTMFNQG